MKRLVLFALLALASCAKAEKEEEAPEPTALVTVALVRSEAVSDVVSVYGVVQADPAASINVAAPRAVIVSRVLVRAGEPVAAGQPVVEVANAPASELAYRQAADAVTAARSDLARLQRMYAERLATNDQLIAARKTLADAQAALAAEQQQGAGRPVQTLTAPTAAIVTNVAVSPGDHVAQDAPLVTLARAGAASAKLGLEPALGRFAPGEAVTLRPAVGGPPIASRLTLVGRAPDQTTKTLDATAPLNGAVLPIGAAVRADVTTGVHTGLVVPRSAVVFDETGTHVFTVSGGKAHRVFVKVGADAGDDIEVSGPIGAGALVAVQGAYELQDGMAVKVAGR